MNLLGQGGVPNKGLLQNGVIKYVELEHVWVEAWVDQFPSRASVQRASDSWVQLDAAFKQYSFTAPLDLLAEVPFDVQAFVDAAQARATINEQESWVSGVDASLLQMPLAEYQDRVQAYVVTAKPQATIADVIGAKAIVPRQSGVLPSGLPYKRLSTTVSTASLPNSLRHQFRFILTDAYGQTLLDFQRATPALAGKELALSFRPASQADADLIASYLPQAGSSDDVGSLPQSLPGYLINVIAEWTVDGQVLASGGPFTVGAELTSERGVWSPQNGWQLRRKVLAAGEYHAIGLDLQGFGAEQFARMQERGELLKAKLEARDGTGLTKHDLTGLLMQSGVLGYMAQNDIQDRLQADVSGVVTYRMPSFGAFLTRIQTVYWFGIPRNVRFSGVVMDIDQLQSATVAADNSIDRWIAFNQASGARFSANEHLVPERLVSGLNPAAEALSAVKALGLAAAQGQRIYTVTQANYQSVLPQLSIGADVKTEIRNAAIAGKQITVSQAEVTHHGWSGTGYIILDPNTGAGAYKISGGANGGELVLPGLVLAFLQGIAPVLMFTPWAIVIAGVAGFIANTLMSLSIEDPIARADYASARFLALVGGFVLALILTQTVYMVIPPLFILSVLLAMLTAMYAILAVILSEAAPRYRREVRLYA